MYRPPVRSMGRTSLAVLALAVLPACGAGGVSADSSNEGTGGAAAGAGGAAGKGGAGASGGAAQAGTGGKGGAVTIGGFGGGGASGTGGASGAAGAGGGGGAGGSMIKMCLPDDDMDSLSNDVEGKGMSVDSDGDGIPDYLDPDSDNDSIPDLLESQTAVNGCMNPQDSDGDGKPDFRDTDSDNNGLPDLLEVYPDGLPYSAAKGPPADTDGDKIPDYADTDNDDDSLLDTAELVMGKSVDTDKDGLPDQDDPDSDNDTIQDGKDGTGDFDKDGIPNFRDTDSDGDGIPDKCEAGPNHQLSQQPVDTDKDGKSDFLDLDSDADGLLDKDEDKNGNCLVDDGETDRIKSDTDGDGVGDLIEVALGSDPLDPISTPASLGKFYFILPYNQPAVPDAAVLAVNTALQRADVEFVIDTTGTMSGELSSLKTSVASISQKLGGVIPDLQVGIAGHDDYPVGGFGFAPDLPFYIPTGGKITNVAADTTTALAALSIHNGMDDPESQITAMWASLVNDWYTWPTGPLVAPDNSIPADRFGRMGFRKNALPVVVGISDAPFHDGKRVSSPASLHDTYYFNAQSPYPPPTIDTLVQTMKTTGAHYIGVAADDGIRSGDPYEDMAYLSEQTGSMAPPSAFGVSGKCKTALGGNDLASPDGTGGKCRLVFDVYKNGVGLGDRVVDGVTALLKSLLLDVRVLATPDTPNAGNGFVDSVDQFIDHVEVSTSGGDDPTVPGAPCVVLPIAQVADQWTGAKGLLPGGDTYWDTVHSVVPTTKICFNVVPIPNKLIKPTAVVQTFHAVLQVRAKIGSGTTEVDFGVPRDVLFIIPPAPQLAARDEKRNARSGDSGSGVRALGADANWLVAVTTYLVVQPSAALGLAR